MATKSPPLSIQDLFNRLDRLIDRLNAILSTPGGIDSGLQTLGYTLTFVHYRLSARLSRKLQSLANTIAENASTALLPGETVVAQIPAPPGTARLARATAASKKLADLISDFRIFVRLWALLGIYAWGKGVYRDPPDDWVIKGIAWAQVALAVVYQVLENGAYLSQHGVMGWDAKGQTQAWLWSARFLWIHVVLEFVRLGREWRLRKPNGTEAEEKEEKVKRQADDYRWWKDAVVNAGYFPLCIHWGVEKGAMSEGLVSFIGMIIGIIGFRERWKATA